MSEFNPLVSIVIPVYNGSNYMRSAIDSALNQTYQNIEVIVVNDGSKDNTDEIARSYGDKIRYFDKENGGVASALNLAIKEARGYYISWLSHDDFYLPEKVSRQIQKLEELGCLENKILISDYINENITTNTTETIKLSGIFTNSDKANSIKLLHLSVLHGCTLLVPKKAFEEVAYFDTALKTTQDYSLWFKFINAGYVFAHINESLVQSRLHEQQDSHTKVDICEKEKQDLFKNASKMFFKDIIDFADEDYSVIRQTLRDNRLKSVCRKIEFFRKFPLLKKLVK